MSKQLYEYRVKVITNRLGDKHYIPEKRMSETFWERVLHLLEPNSFWMEIHYPNKECKVRTNEEKVKDAFSAIEECKSREIARISCIKV